jgi:NADH:ubiquinone oxidoreductase subunit 5 (subunit L)/multisubunit Na+/H+ antiporter MnhA subunit
MSSETLLIAIIATPFGMILVLGLIWLLGGHLPEKQLAFSTKLLSLLLTAGLATLGWRLQTTGTLSVSLGQWFQVGHYHFPVVLVLDGVALAMLSLTVVLAGIAGVFAIRYLHRDPGFHRFFILLHLFLFGSLLIFSAGSLDLLIAGWELVGITSILLIGFFQYRPDPVRNALRVFGTYRIADLCILTAAFIAHHQLGSALWSDLQGHAKGADVFALLLALAACGKSAQGPFAGWLPRAMEGPTPSSAVFYGAISVHAGAYLLLRAEPIIRESTIATICIILIGSITAVVATLVQRTCSDAKTSLAYAAQTQLGIIFVEIALGWTTLALIHTMGHALLRTMQFLRAPSMLHDHHRVHTAAGGHLPPTGSHYSALLPQRLQLFLYRIALGRGFYDALLDRFIIAPVRGTARLLAVLEPDWVKPQRLHQHKSAQIIHAALSRPDQFQA